MERRRTELRESESESVRDKVSGWEKRWCTVFFSLAWSRQVINGNLEIEFGCWWYELQG